MQQLSSGSLITVQKILLDALLLVSKLHCLLTLDKWTHHLCNLMNYIMKFFAWWMTPREFMISFVAFCFVSGSVPKISKLYWVMTHGNLLVFSVICIHYCSFQTWNQRMLRMTQNAISLNSIIHHSKTFSLIQQGQRICTSTPQKPVYLW